MIAASGLVRQVPCTAPGSISRPYGAAGCSAGFAENTPCPRRLRRFLTGCRASLRGRFHARSSARVRASDGSRRPFPGRDPSHHVWGSQTSLSFSRMTLALEPLSECPSPYKGVGSGSSGSQLRPANGVPRFAWCRPGCPASPAIQTSAAEPPMKPNWKHQTIFTDGHLRVMRGMNAYRAGITS